MFVLLGDAKAGDSLASKPRIAPGMELAQEQILRVNICWRDTLSSSAATGFECATPTWTFTIAGLPSGGMRKECFGLDGCDEEILARQTRSRREVALI